MSLEHHLIRYIRSLRKAAKDNMRMSVAPKFQDMIWAYHRPCGASKLAARLRLAIQYADTGVILRPRRVHRPDMNWGCGDRDFGDTVLNHDIRPAISKVSTFNKLGEASVPVPRFSKELAVLRGQLKPDRKIIARRDGLSGGRDMSLVIDGVDLPFRTDFFVERLSCHREFRIHVFQGEVIHKQAKFVPHGFEGIAKNWENGCYFTSEGLERFANEQQLGELSSLAIRSVEALGLQFGAVDLLLTKKLQPYVLEVNTAPGLRSEATYQAYEGAIRKLYGL